MWNWRQQQSATKDVVEKPRLNVSNKENVGCAGNIIPKVAVSHAADKSNALLDKAKKNRILSDRNLNVDDVAAKSQSQQIIRRGSPDFQKILATQKWHEKFLLPQEKAPCTRNVKTCDCEKNAGSSDFQVIPPHEVDYYYDSMNLYIKYLANLDIRQILNYGTEKNSLSKGRWTEMIRYLTKIHAMHNIPSFMLYQNVKILNTYCQMVNANEVSCPVLAIASMWITLKKYVECPNLPKMRVVHDYLPCYVENSKKKLVAAEKNILKHLHFDINFCDPFAIIEYFLITKNVPDAKTVFSCASYMVDLSLHERKLVVYSTVTVAVAALEIALFILSKKKDMPFTDIRAMMISTYGFITDDLMMEDVDILKRDLFDLVLRSRQQHSIFYHIYKKYTHRFYGKVSQVVDLLNLHDSDAILSIKNSS